MNLAVLALLFVESDGRNVSLDRTSEESELTVRQDPLQTDILFLKSMPVGFSDSHPALYVVQGRAKPALHGPNSTEPNLFRHEETTYRVG